MLHGYGGISIFIVFVVIFIVVIVFFLAVFFFLILVGDSGVLLRVFLEFGFFGFLGGIFSLGSFVEGIERGLLLLFIILLLIPKPQNS